MNQPTIADVARLAGVSVATVSRALRGLDKVHPETRDRVIAAAAQLDYIASPEAAGLASGRSRLIGVITPFMARWFFTEMMSAIEKVFRDHQHHILLMDLEERSPEVRLALTQNMMFKRVDGLIVINVAFRSSEAEVIKRLNLPVVAVGNAFNGAPLVGIDDVGCAALGTQHLIDLGHTALGYVGKARPHNPHGKTPPDRLQGFVDALHEADVRLRHDWILECDWSAADAYAGALKLLASPDRPTAILAGSDEMALGVMAGARELGLRVPQDLSVIGIDDHDLARVFGLTTVRQDVVEQGRAAAHAMLALLGLADESLARSSVYPVHLLPRTSTCPPGTPARRA